MINISSGLPSISLAIVLLFAFTVFYYLIWGRKKGVNSMTAEVDEEEK